MQPFHLAFPTANLEKTSAFMTDVIGASIGRTSERWVDFNFFGHQITSHLVDDMDEAAKNPVDGQQVPAFHFGIIMQWDDWQALADRVDGKGVPFEIGPYIRFAGEVGEQGTFFIREPGSNTALEFKTFRNFDQIFAT